MYNKKTVLKSQFRYPLSRFSPHAPQDNFAYVRVQLPQVLVCCTAAFSVVTLPAPQEEERCVTQQTAV